MDSFIHLLENFIEIGKTRAFWHGDLKPENMIISRTSELIIRPIDPINALPNKNSSVLPLMGIFTVSYNPKGYLKERADAFGLALVIFEIYTGDQPFKGYKRLEWDGQEDKKHPLIMTLESYFLKYYDDEFANWLLGWILKTESKIPVSNNRHTDMLENLRRFKEQGVKLLRYV